MAVTLVDFDKPDELVLQPVKPGVAPNVLLVMTWEEPSAKNVEEYVRISVLPEGLRKQVSQALRNLKGTGSKQYLDPFGE